MKMYIIYNKKGATKHIETDLFDTKKQARENLGYNGIRALRIATEIEIKEIKNKSYENYHDMSLSVKYIKECL
jgi:hypothetical protein